VFFDIKITFGVGVQWSVACARINRQA